MLMPENLRAGGATRSGPDEMEYLNVLDMYLAHMFRPVLEPQGLVITHVCRKELSAF